MLYVPFSSYLTLNNRDLEKVTEDHSNWYHRKLERGFLFAFHAAVSLTVYEIFSVKE